MVSAAVWLLSAAVEKAASAPSDTGNSNLWIVVGVVIPLLVVIIIISILYWKLCRTDKLEFQPDAMTSIQQRQKVDPLQSVLFHLFIYYLIDRRWLLSFWEHLTHFLQYHIFENEEFWINKTFMIPVDIVLKVKKW